MKSESQAQTLRREPFRLERRRKPRVSLPFPVTVLWVDGEGQLFEAATVVDNLCSGGLYLRLLSGVPEGAKLLVTVCLKPGDGRAETGLTLECYGEVRRVDRIPGGAFGVAISFTSSVLV